jgi:hypothetical protein
MRRARYQVGHQINVVDAYRSRRSGRSPTGRYPRRNKRTCAREARERARAHEPINAILALKEAEPAPRDLERPARVAQAQAAPRDREPLSPFKRPGTLSTRPQNLTFFTSSSAARRGSSFSGFGGSGSGCSGLAQSPIADKGLPSFGHKRGTWQARRKTYRALWASPDRRPGLRDELL